MAEYFSAEWNDITVAFPVNILEIDTINALARKIKLNLLVESVTALTFLKENLRSKTGIFVKIDLGSHRTGLDPNNISEIDRLLENTDNTEGLDFKGFLGHSGHTYYCKSKEEILTIHNKSLETMRQLRERYSEKYPDLLISIGDTPGCSLAANFSGTDEIRPGNFVFYDLMQLECVQIQLNKLRLLWHVR